VVNELVKVDKVIVEVSSSNSSSSSSSSASSPANAAKTASRPLAPNSIAASIPPTIGNRVPLVPLTIKKPPAPTPTTAVPTPTITVLLALTVTVTVGIRVVGGIVIVEADLKGFITMVVKGVKVGPFAGFPVVEEFEGFVVVKGIEVEVDVLDEEVDVLENEVDVLDQETIAVEDEFDVEFEEIGFEGVDVEFK
jgi:hypothetical protein